MTLIFVMVLVLIVSLFIIKDARLVEQPTPSDNPPPNKPSPSAQTGVFMSETTPQSTAVLSNPVRPDRDARTGFRPAKGPASYPRRGDTVILRGVVSNGTDIHPAMITRSFGNYLVNVTLLPDGAMPLPLLNVEIFDSAEQAEQYLASVAPARPVVCWPQSNTDSESLK